MGGGGSKTTTNNVTQASGTSNNISEMKLPQWVDEAGQANVKEAQRIADKPYEAYEGTVVPDLSRMTQKTLEWIRQNAGAYQPLYEEAGNATRILMGRGDTERGDLKDYLNPYTDEVERRVIENMNRKGTQDQNAIMADASAKRAFGGSRQAIQQAVQGGETTRAIGDASANLRMAGYDKARAAQEADWGRQFKNKETGAMLSRQEAELAKMAQQGLTTDYFTLLTGGKIAEDHQREMLEEEYRKFVEKRDYDKEGLALQLSTLGLTPYGNTTTSQGSYTGTSSSQGQSKTQQGMNWGSLLTGGLGLLGGLSDRTEKTNIQKLGTDPATELPVYAYDYKADVKAKKVVGPKRVGYMAQDVEKKYPKAVKKIAGKRVIDFTQLPLG